MAKSTAELDAGRELLSLGVAVIKAIRARETDAMDGIALYTESFESWQKTWKKGAENPMGFSAKEREIGERIAEQHSLVLSLVEGMLRDVEQSLKDLRGWSKGIRAYMDHFPKKVSTIRARKG